MSTAADRLLVHISIGVIVGLISGLCLLAFIRTTDHIMRDNRSISGTDLVGSSPSLFVISSSLFIPKLILPADEAAAGFGYYALAVVGMALLVVAVPTYNLVKRTAQHVGRE